MIRRLLAVAVSAAALVLTSGIAPAAAHDGDGGRDHEHGPAQSYYLALGDSLAAGFQPGLGDNKTGGYAGLVLRSIRAEQPKTRLVNLGCSGETTTTLIGGGICRYDEGSQLAQAVEFLHDHRRTTRLVTIDIGANNVTPCVRPALDAVCTAEAVSTVGRDLARILRAVRAAAPGVEIVVLNYYDPFLAAWFLGPAGQALAAQSVLLLGVLNATIAADAVAVGGRVADVATAFATTDSSGAPVPVNVSLVCAWTWMCSRQDIHPNDVGYAVLAAAVNAAR